MRGWMVAGVALAWVSMIGGCAGEPGDATQASPQGAAQAGGAGGVREAGVEAPRCPAEACGLISEEEMSVVLGKPESEREEDGDAAANSGGGVRLRVCEHSTEGLPLAVATVMVRCSWAGDDAGWEGVEKQLASIPGGSLEAVGGVGEEALWHVLTSGKNFRSAQLDVRVKPGVLLIVGVTGNFDDVSALRQRAVGAARGAIARMP